MQASHRLISTTKLHNPHDGKKQMEWDSGQDDLPHACFHRWPLVQPWTAGAKGSYHQTECLGQISSRMCDKIEVVL